MILSHNTRYCEIGKTRILRAPVFKQQIKNITPYKIYADNIEMFAAFGDTVANFSPISLNIVDYWNKSTKTHDTYVWAPIGEPPLVETSDPAFGWKKSDNHGFKNSRKEHPPKNPDGMENDGSTVTGGYPIKTGDGRLLGQSRRSYIQGDNEKEDGSCLDDNLRYFINPLIGVQDKLAMTYLNNFYSVYHKAKQNPTLRSRLLKIAADKSNNFDPNKYFNRPNHLFTEEKTVANKTFIMKKGTEVGLKYAQKSAFDAELQGPMSRFFMEIKTPNPLEYHVNSNILEDLFEKFVKPLAHPIGFIYDYRSVCKVLGAEDIDHPMIRYQFTSKRIEVNCLCKKEIKHRDAKGNEITDSVVDAIGIEEEDKTHEIHCGGKYQPVPKVFALSKDALIQVPDPKDPKKKVNYMPGLWDGIAQDAWGIEGPNGEMRFNILKEYKTSFAMFRGGLHKYKKYIFENGSYLIAWYIQAKVQDEAPKVIIEYYRTDYSSITGYTNAVTFENDVHCNIADNLTSTREHQIREDFKVDCVPTQNGPFIMDVLPGDPNASGNQRTPKGDIGPITKGDTLPGGVVKYRGFMTQPDQLGHVYGGKIIGWSIFTNPTQTKLKKP